VTISRDPNRRDGDRAVIALSLQQSDILSKDCYSLGGVGWAIAPEMNRIARVISAPPKGQPDDRGHRRSLTFSGSVLPTGGGAWQPACCLLESNRVISRRANGRLLYLDGIFGLVIEVQRQCP
jgi:hypothetical protein